MSKHRPHGPDASPEARAWKAERNRSYRARRTAREKQAQREAAELAEKLRAAGITEEDQANREEWLTWALDLLRPVFVSRGYTLPDKIRVALGWPRGKNILGRYFPAEVSAGGYVEIFVSPTLSDPLEVVDVLTHELCHAAVGFDAGHRGPFVACATALDLTGKPSEARGIENPAWQAWAGPLARKLGPMPHDSMTPPPAAPGQRSRMLKLKCEHCGLTMRMAQKWVDECGADMHCPDSKCFGKLSGD